ncbi:hypothetical protein [Polyangium aurulentum]|uniref:hypothetical protein n=1 Tax=Polyangium aurulentum TaxID=2567896 RepID=UPI0010AE27A4|nr:hypothetical protein [Polyangium aurulentum]UQA60570.1 hypothetical protein E8A73_008890 [Polyangium aurulentum]
MKPMKSEKGRWFGWLLVPLMLLAVPLLSGCVVVADGCSEGEQICSGDAIEECIDDEWFEIEDCFSFCGGTCVYLDDLAACAC